MVGTSLDLPLLGDLVHPIPRPLTPRPSLLDHSLLDHSLLDRSSSTEMEFIHAVTNSLEPNEQLFSKTAYPAARPPGCLSSLMIDLMIQLEEPIIYT